MCLILLSYERHPVYRLVLAANRDEYYNRPTAPLARIDTEPDIFGGRDLKHQGMWLGITRTGRFSAITNFRDPGLSNLGAPSRGFLVRDFLISGESPRSYLEHVKSIGDQYNGFNLLVGDATGLFYYSNRGDGIHKIEPGIHGLSNHLMDTPWPKISKGKAKLLKVIENNEAVNTEDIFDLLKDNSYPPVNTLPDTGVGFDWERVLSPLFITSSFYGTRSSSIILMDRAGEITFMERTFIPDGTQPGEDQTRKFTFRISEMD